MTNPAADAVANAEHFEALAAECDALAQAAHARGGDPVRHAIGRDQYLRQARAWRRAVDHDTRTVTPAQHLALGQLAVGDGSVDHHARATVRTLMGRGLIEAATGADGDLVFDAAWRVVYTLTERGRATVAARRLHV